MFGFHPDKQLVAYMQGELDAKRRQRIEVHLQRCARCRHQAEALRQAHLLLTDLPTLSAPEGLWDRIEAALPEAPSSAPLPSNRRRILRPRWQPGFAAAVLLLVVSSVSWRFLRRPLGPTLAVASLAGMPRIGADGIGKTGRLGVGQWLETDGASRAEITVADIGTVKVEPNSRIGLKVTGSTSTSGVPAYRDCCEVAVKRMVRLSIGCASNEARPPYL